MTAPGMQRNQRIAGLAVPRHIDAHAVSARAQERRPAQRRVAVAVAQAGAGRGDDE